MTVMTHSLYTVPVIEKCANYLGINTRTSSGDKVYRNKKLMVDQVILKIQACFPTICDECTLQYRNTLNDTPMFTCFICWQGSHNCPAIQQQDTKFEGQPPAGLVWLCHDCKERNQLVPTNNTNNSNSHSAEEEADETADTGAEENAEERQSPRRNMPGQVNAAKEDVPANTDTVNPPPFDGQQSAPKIAQRRDTKASDNRQNLENRPVCLRPPGLWASRPEATQPPDQPASGPEAISVSGSEATRPLGLQA
ncbi:unnamed protein product [Gadus morhua 'NCC']